MLPMEHASENWSSGLYLSFESSEPTASGGSWRLPLSIATRWWQWVLESCCVPPCCQHGCTADCCCHALCLQQFYRQDYEIFLKKSTGKVKMLIIHSTTQDEESKSSIPVFHKAFSKVSYLFLLESSDLMHFWHKLKFLEVSTLLLKTHWCHDSTA